MIFVQSASAMKKMITSGFVAIAAPTGTLMSGAPKSALTTSTVAPEVSMAGRR
jgi:hypothetical protein